MASFDSSQQERATQQRSAIRLAFGGAGRPLSAAELHELARSECPNLGMSTVYRELKRLQECGEIAPVEVSGGPMRYELAEAAAKHHHHFRCDSCDRVFDLDGCPGGLTQLLPSGFELREHELTLVGTCAECNNADDQ